MAYRNNADLIDAKNNLLSLQLQAFKFEESNELIIENINANNVLANSASVIEALYAAIYSFMIGNVEASRKCLSYVTELPESPEFAADSNSDRKFIKAYHGYLKRLTATRKETVQSEGHRKIFHLGDSHCLSFANCDAVIGGKFFTVSPRIIFGAKAFHFSVNKKNSFKTFAREHFSSMEKNSFLLISFGEIDCRYDEGLITAHRQKNLSMSELIEATVSGYISFFMDCNKKKHHTLYFLNVPAPVRKKEISDKLNSEVSSCIEAFNSTLQKTIEANKLRLIDLHSMTRDPSGFSNNLFHCDGVHLDNRIFNSIKAKL